MHDTAHAHKRPALYAALPYQCRLDDKRRFLYKDSCKSSRLKDCNGKERPDCLACKGPVKVITKPLKPNAPIATANGQNITAAAKMCKCGETMVLNSKINLCAACHLKRLNELDKLIKMSEKQKQSSNNAAEAPAPQAADQDNAPQDIAAGAAGDLAHVVPKSAHIDINPAPENEAKGWPTAVDWDPMREMMIQELLAAIQMFRECFAIHEPIHQDAARIINYAAILRKIDKKLKTGSKTGSS